MGSVIEAEIYNGTAYALQRLRNLAGELASDVARGHRVQVQDGLQIVQRFTPRFLQVTVYDTQGAVLVSSSLTEVVEPPVRGQAHAMTPTRTDRTSR